jgi:hypothetical protein
MLGKYFCWTIPCRFCATLNGEMLSSGLFAPTIQEDDIRVFALPLGGGHISLETLSDLSALAMFQNREEWSGKTLNTVSHFATGQ